MDGSGETMEFSPETMDGSGETMEFSPETMDGSGETVEFSPESMDGSGESTDASRETMDIIRKSTDGTGKRKDLTRDFPSPARASPHRWAKSPHRRVAKPEACAKRPPQRRKAANAGRKQAGRIGAAVQLCSDAIPRRPLAPARRRNLPHPRPIPCPARRVRVMFGHGETQIGGEGRIIGHGRPRRSDDDATIDGIDGTTFDGMGIDGIGIGGRPRPRPTVGIARYPRRLLRGQPRTTQPSSRCVRRFDLYRSAVQFESQL